MKKILTIFATAAMFLGLASCSGDMHNDVSPEIQALFGSSQSLAGYFLVGDIQSKAWNENDNSLVLSATSGASGSYETLVNALGSEANFAILPTVGTWNGQIGGDKITSDKLPSGITYEDTDNGNGGRNATLKGLSKGNVYKLVFDTSSGSIKLSVTEQKTPNYFLLDGYFIRGIGNDFNTLNADNLLCNPAKDPSTGDCTYKLSFTATATEEKLTIARKDWNAGRFGLSADTKFTVDSDEVKLTEKLEKNAIVTGLTSGNIYNIFVKTTVDGTVTLKVEAEKLVFINKLKIINADDYEGKVVYFLDGALPGNQWDATTPNKATISNGVGEYEIAKTTYISPFVKLQLICQLDSSDFWADGNKIGGGEKSVANPKDNAINTLVYDCSSEELKLE